MIMALRRAISLVSQFLQGSISILKKNLHFKIRLKRQGGKNGFMVFEKTNGRR